LSIYVSAAHLAEETPSRLNLSASREISQARTEFLRTTGKESNMRRFNSSMRACGIVLLWAATAAVLPAQGFKTLLSFNGTDGANPTAGLAQGTNGKFYGSTEYGGANGQGTVFTVTSSGTLTTLYSFCAQPDCLDGANPTAALIQATNGKFYGTAQNGGADGLGTVFTITPSGELTTLHSFDGTDGVFPHVGLTQATNGKFYGTTSNGGANGDGVVFTITPSGTFIALHSFDGTDGVGPAGLVQGTEGDFYGTTAGGGTNSDGTVFRITPNGTVTTLHSFDNTDGATPLDALVQGTDGDFYGTTAAGGTNDDCFQGGACGTVFKITTNGTLTTLHSFDNTDGANPQVGLIQGTDGNFYGTTLNGGASNYGTVFRITPSGTVTTLHSFDGTDGGFSIAGLIEGTNGKLYGTTVEGGSSKDGTVFGLSAGLGPHL